MSETSSYTLQELRDQGWTWRRIAAHLNISERTVYRRNAENRQQPRRKSILVDVDQDDAVRLAEQGRCAGDPNPGWVSDPRPNIGRAVALRRLCTGCPVRSECATVIQPVRVRWDGVAAGDVYLEGRPLGPADIRDLFEAQLSRFLSSDLKTAPLAAPAAA